MCIIRTFFSHNFFLNRIFYRKEHSTEPSILHQLQGNGCLHRQANSHTLLLVVFILKLTEKAVRNKDDKSVDLLSQVSNY